MARSGDQSGETKPLLDTASLRLPIAGPSAPYAPPETVEVRHSRGRKIVGYSCTLISVVGLAIGGCCAQALGGTLPDFELNTWRYTPQFLFCLPIAIYKWRIVIPSKTHAAWLFVACVASVAYNVFYYTACKHLKMGIVGGLNPSFTLIFITFMSMIFSRKCNLHTMVALVVCIAGILMITQPGFHELLAHDQNGTLHPLCHKDTGNNTSNTSDTSNTTGGGSESGKKTDDTWGYIYVLLGSFCASIARIVTNRKLHDLDSLVATFWVGAVGVISSGIIMLAAEYDDIVFPKELQCNMLVAGHALGAGIGAMCALIGAQTVPPVIYAMLQTFQVILLFIAQYSVMKKIFPPSNAPAVVALEAVGTLVLLAGIVITPVVTLCKQRRARQREEAMAAVGTPSTWYSNSCHITPTEPEGPYFGEWMSRSI